MRADMGIVGIFLYTHPEFGCYPEPDTRGILCVQHRLDATYARLGVSNVFQRGARALGPVPRAKRADAVMAFMSEQFIAPPDG